MRYEQVMQRAESDGGEAALLSGADPRHPREPVRRRLRRSRSCSPCQSFSVFTFVLAVIVVGVILNRGFEDFGLHKAFLYSYYMLHIYFSLNFHLLPFLPQIRKSIPVRLHKAQSPTFVNTVNQSPVRRPNLFHQS